MAPPMDGTASARPTTTPAATAGLRLHQAGSFFSAAAQLAILASMPSSFLNIVQAILKVGLAAAVLRWPHVYWRNRSWILPVGRLAVFALPCNRRAKLGIASLLEREAQPGALGAWADLGRTLIGTRLLAVMVGGFVSLQAPASMLLTQITLTYLISGGATGAYCSSTLMLTNPLSQQRVGLLAYALELAAYPAGLLLPAGRLMARPEAITSAAGTVDAPRVCHATLSFLNLLLGVLGPTMVSVCVWQPLPTSQPAQAAEAGHDGDAAAAAAAAAVPTVSTPGRAALLAGSLEKLGSTADAALHALLWGERPRLHRAMICWYCLALCWWSCCTAVGLV